MIPPWAMPSWLFFGTWDSCPVNYLFWTYNSLTTTSAHSLELSARVVVTCTVNDKLEPADQNKARHENAQLWGLHPSSLAH